MAQLIVPMTYTSISELPEQVPGIVGALLFDCRRWHREGYYRFGANTRLAWAEAGAPEDVFLCEMEARAIPDVNDGVQLRVRIFIAGGDERNLLEATAFGQVFLALGNLRQHNLRNSEDGWTYLNVAYN